MACCWFGIHVWFPVFVWMFPVFGGMFPILVWMFPVFVWMFPVFGGMFPVLVWMFPVFVWMFPDFGGMFPILVWMFPVFVWMFPVFGGMFPILVWMFPVFVYMCAAHRHGGDDAHSCRQFGVQNGAASHWRPKDSGTAGFVWNLWTHERCLSLVHPRLRHPCGLVVFRLYHDPLVLSFKWSCSWDGGPRASASPQPLLISPGYVYMGAKQAGETHSLNLNFGWTLWLNTQFQAWDWHRPRPQLRGEIVLQHKRRWKESFERRQLGEKKARPRGDP
jgi:hypothetical protein